MVLTDDLRAAGCGPHSQPRGRGDQAEDHKGPPTECRGGAGSPKGANDGPCPTHRHRLCLDLQYGRRLDAGPCSFSGRRKIVASTRRMHLGLFILGTGSHIAGWRYPGAVKSFEDLGSIQEIARTAERGKFDIIFMGDNLYADPAAHPSYTLRLEPLTMMAALAMSTSRIGLGATSSTTYGDPFSVARAFASLDHISRGRAAWNAVTTANLTSGANFGMEHPSHALRYARAEEFIQVVTKLWDAWADDALVADRQTGVYIDPQKLRSIDHVGRFFKVKGPINIGRAPQGRPVVLQTGGSEPGQALAARTADVVFSVTQDLDEAKAAYASVKNRLPAYGRSADELTILPGVMPVVGRTDREARDKLATLQGFLNATNGLQLLSDRLGQGMTDYDRR